MTLLCVGGKFDFVWQVGVFIELPSEGSLLNLLFLLILLEQLAIPYFTCLADLHRGRPLSRCAAHRKSIKGPSIAENKRPITVSPSFLPSFQQEKGADLGNASRNTRERDYYTHQRHCGHRADTRLKYGPNCSCTAFARQRWIYTAYPISLYIAVICSIAKFQGCHAS